MLQSHVSDKGTREAHRCERLCLVPSRRPGDEEADGAATSGRGEHRAGAVQYRLRGLERGTVLFSQRYVTFIAKDGTVKVHNPFAA